MTTTHSSAPSGIADDSTRVGLLAGRGRLRIVAEGFAGSIFCPHFAHIIPRNRENTRESTGIRKAAQPYFRKAKRLVSAEADWWRRGELNPGPMTEPTVFYVRSLLAKLAIFLPPSMSQTTDGEHIRS